MVKLFFSELKAIRPMENDAKFAIARDLTVELQSKILGGVNNISNEDMSQMPVCDAVCYPSEMGVCHCYKNLA
jgi:hypothetical protein